MHSFLKKFGIKIVNIFFTIVLGISLVAGGVYVYATTWDGTSNSFGSGTLTKEDLNNFRDYLTGYTDATDAKVSSLPKTARGEFMICKTYCKMVRGDGTISFGSNSTQSASCTITFGAGFTDKPYVTLSRISSGNDWPFSITGINPTKDDILVQSTYAGGEWSSGCVTFNYIATE